MSCEEGREKEREGERKGGRERERELGREKEKENVTVTLVFTGLRITKDTVLSDNPIPPPQVPSP